MRRSLVALALALVLPLPVLAGQVTVKEGETLSEIADHYGLTVNQLMKLNGLNNADHVEAGQTINVPGASAGRSGSRGSGGSASGHVTVQDGDTLSEIADRHGMSVNQLMKLNGLGNADHVETGQTLLVNAPSKSSSTGSGFRKGASEHVVRSGESLSVIADGYGIGMNKLIAINGISDPDHVEAGTRLKLKGSPPVLKPASTKPASTKPASTKAAASKPAIAQPVSQPLAAKPVAPRPRPVANVTRPVQTAAVSTPATKASLPATVAKTPATVASAPTTVARTPATETSAPATVASTRATVASTQATVASTSATVASTENRVSTPATVTPAATTVASAPTRVAPSPARAAAVAEVESQPGPEIKPATSVRPTPRNTRALNTSTRSTPTTTTAASVEVAKPMLNNPLIATASATSRPAISDRQTINPRATSAITRPINTTVTRATVTSKPVATVATASRPATTAVAAASGKPDWRTYGPLQVDWTGWQPMGGSMVAPTLNAQGQSLYLAINCGARKLNATTQNGDWKTWDDPSSDFELQLVNDYCRSRG